MGSDRIVIVGSGLAGSILARLLVAGGRRVTLVERGSHPRFAIGESSTPLAAICLERLAAEYGLPDLAALAAYGRWGRELPGLRRGLKRGFTFYGHHRGRPFHNDESNCARLLVAASPSNDIADAHWLRSDVDAYLVDRAVEEGVEYVDRCDLERLDARPGGWRLTGTREGRVVTLDAAFIVDASGPGGFLATLLGLGRSGPASPIEPRTGLVFGHFDGVAPFVETAQARGASFPDPPYPEERAAIHHLLEEGWMYVLPFDDGVVSAGILLDREHPDTHRLVTEPPDVAWSRVLSRYPTIEAQFAGAHPVRPLATMPRVQRRLDRAAGAGWALLPHSFCFISPMFSTGIAWSLVAVERLAAALVESPGTVAADTTLLAYDRLLSTEADALGALIGPAYRLRGRFDAFSAWTQLYFAAASYSEVWQRLGPPPDGGWTGVGFLGACDPEIRSAVRAAWRDLRAGGAVDDSVVAERIARRNVAGLADAGRKRSYPVDLDALVERADLMGMTREEMIAALPQLRG